MGSFLFSPYGRISRRTYWLNWILPYIAVSIAVTVLDYAMFPINPNTGEPTPVFQAIAGLILLWPSLATTTKRLHDRGLTGWWQAAPLLALIPIAMTAYWYYSARLENGASPSTFQDNPLAMLGVVVGGLVALGVVLYVLINTLFLRGQAGPNKYGEDPLGGIGDTFK